MDILATSPASLLINPIAQSYQEFALLYKEAHKLKFVPPPATKKKVLTDVLNEINGNETRQTRIVEDAKMETPTDITPILRNLATSSSLASQIFIATPPKIIIAGNPAIKPCNIIVLPTNIKSDC